MSARRTAVLTALTVATLTALTAQQAGAVTKPVKPITKTYYFHGSSPVGESENPPTSNTTLSMDAKKPTGSDVRSYGVTNALATPNTKCSNNTLFPVWTGPATGFITGTAKVTIFTASSPAAKVTVRIFADPGPTACNDTFVEPMGTATVDVPAGAGSVTATLKIASGKLSKVSSDLVVEITPAILQSVDTPQGTKYVFGPSATRVLYDSASYPSAITFSCLPKPGKKTC